ncbi:MAG: calcium-binding protein [Dehalococcoidia bacterium]
MDDPDPTVVTTADDCTVSPNDCSLRGATLAAAANGASTDAITLPAGTYTLTSTGASGGDLFITSSLILTGDGADDTIIDADGGAFFDRVMHISCSCAVELSALTLTGGRPAGPNAAGGGLLVSSSTVAMDGVHITDNIATESGAGSGARGGGIDATNSNVTLTNSAVTANQAVGAGISSGGGIRLINSSLAMRNGTISGNTSGGSSGSNGGGLRMDGASTFVQMANITISNNTATTNGAGISRSDGSGAIVNTMIVANNGAECSTFGTALSSGHNLSDDSTCNDTFDETSDLEEQAGTHLAALADNGGTTPTHALLAASTGVDAADTAICNTLTTAFGNADTTDQRGAARVADGDNNSTADCDIGAFELEPDSDGDGVTDSADNCPNDANADQANFDNDGEGDACDSDDDNDGIADGSDDCEQTPTSTNVAADGCPDPDNDDVSTFAGDNCPSVANANQTNTDGEGEGDACDGDDDNDTILDGPDNCPLTANTNQADVDGDGTGDVCDGVDNRPTCSGQPATVLDHSGAITGTSGDDVLVGDGGVNTINGGGGNDIICGRAGNDVLIGGAGGDNLFGQGGNDLLNGGASGDLLNGGAGSDTVTYPGGSALTIDLTTGSNNKGDTLAAVENVKGSNAGDTITGNSAANTLEGFGGGDTISGRGGTDTVSGGAGADVLSGGPGAGDTCNGGSGSDSFPGSAAASGCENVSSIP